MSCKGINKKNVVEPYDIFQNVLQNKENKSGINIGFRAKDNTIFTYTQERTGFSYFYCKREVCSDGITTKPLNLVLRPWPDNNVLLVNYDSPLSLYSNVSFLKDNILFLSLYQAIEKACFHNKNELAQQIRACKNMFQFYKINKRYAANSDWYDICKDKMVELLSIYFQIECVKNVLCTNKNIVVCGKDRYWCCGVNYNIAEVIDPSKYIGKNCLGELLNDFRNK